AHREPGHRRHRSLVGAGLGDLPSPGETRREGLGRRSERRRLATPGRAPPEHHARRSRRVVSRRSGSARGARRRRAGAREQRRRGLDRPLRQDGGDRRPHHVRGQRARPHRAHPALPPDHARARPGPHREHLLRGGVVRAASLHHLLVHQVRRAGVHRRTASGDLGQGRDGGQREPGAPAHRVLPAGTAAGHLPSVRGHHRRPRQQLGGLRRHPFHPLPARARLPGGDRAPGARNLPAGRGAGHRTSLRRGRPGQSPVGPDLRHRPL
ncbi:MAG: hypothetical protein AVDCRST_MAG50-1968, partial [uncultured Acidimicrobiales bacterium]